MTAVIAAAESSPSLVWLIVSVGLWILLMQFRHKRRRRWVERRARLRARRRRFSEREKEYMYLEADGLCTGCRRPHPVHYATNHHPPGVFCDDCYEADHIHPHSKGGPTHVSNGAVVCRYYNRRKGARHPRMVRRHR